MPRPKKIKIIPDKLFSALWNIADTENTYENFFFEISKDIINTKLFSCSIDIYSEAGTDFLKSLYLYNKMSFKEIMEKAGKSNKDIVIEMNIKTRTVEEWKSGRNLCPGYIRLMLLRMYGLLNFDGNILPEFDVRYLSNRTVKESTISNYNEIYALKKKENNSSAAVCNKNSYIYEEDRRRMQEISYKELKRLTDQIPCFSKNN